ncbi:MAG TPA: hypothetical protein VF284_08905 [Rhodanobacteraceae bacterium]
MNQQKSRSRQLFVESQAMNGRSGVFDNAASQAAGISTEQRPWLDERTITP